MHIRVQFVMVCLYVSLYICSTVVGEYSISGFVYINIY